MTTPAPGIQHRNDARNLPILCSGGHRDDGLTAFATRGTANEIDLATNAAVEIGADGIGADLAGNIDLQGGIDGHHFVICGNDVGVVGVATGMKLEHRVVVDKIEELLGAQNKTQNNFPAMDRLHAAVDDSRFDQRDGAIAEHLCVDAKILVIRQFQQHRIGNRADPQLQSGAFFHQAGDILADRMVNFCDRARASVRTTGEILPPRHPDHLTWMKLSPKVRGIWSLTWARTNFA